MVSVINLLPWSSRLLMLTFCRDPHAVLPITGIYYYPPPSCITASIDKVVREPIFEANRLDFVIVRYRIMNPKIVKGTLKGLAVELGKQIQGFRQLSDATRDRYIESNGGSGWDANEEDPELLRGGGDAVSFNADEIEWSTNFVVHPNATKVRMNPNKKSSTSEVAKSSSPSSIDFQKSATAKGKSGACDDEEEESDTDVDKDSDDEEREEGTKTSGENKKDYGKCDQCLAVILMFFHRYV